MINSFLWRILVDVPQKRKQEKLHVLMGSQQNIYLHSRHIVVIYISLSFQMMFKYKYVQDDFGHGIIVPFVEDPENDTVNSSNYSNTNNSRSITLNLAISKLFV